MTYYVLGGTVNPTHSLTCYILSILDIKRWLRDGPIPTTFSRQLTVVVRLFDVTVIEFLETLMCYMSNIEFILQKCYSSDRDK